MSTNMKVLPVLAVLIGVGCSDASTVAPTRSLEPASATAAGNLFGAPQKYVAIGTSISMGWASDGVYFGSQFVSWPALIGFGTLQPISLPLIQAPGCISPFVAPLGLGLRLSGESLAGSTVCANNVNGVTLPTQNVALAQALAADALLSTPASKGPTSPFYFRVLPPNMTQLSATLAQRPTTVSVELGANEVLGGLSGLVVPGVTVVPLQGFAVPYDALLDGLATENPKVVLAGLPADGRNLPALRRGAEIWADRAEFAALHVDVSSDCQNNDNFINVSIQSLNLVFAGAAAAQQNLPNPVYSCADIPGTPDLVLTPSDVVVLNGMLAQMTAHIRAQAAARRYAFFSLGALYDRPDLKSGPYSIVAQLTSATPYGPFISLDGVHPSPFGHAILASAAALAFNATYGRFDVSARGVTANVLPSAPSLSLTDQLENAPLPAAALEQAKRIAAANAGRHLSACSIWTLAQIGC